jgi:putative effector of murein hydrolase LrgA (UPF0299 family)
VGPKILRIAAGLALLVLLNLGGGALTNALGLALPGPVAGLALALVVLAAVPPLREAMLDGASALLVVLGGLIVPAAVGLSAFAPLLARQGAALAAVVVLSTLVTGVVTALVYRALATR